MSTHLRDRRVNSRDNHREGRPDPCESSTGAFTGVYNALTGVLWQMHLAPDPDQV